MINAAVNLLFPYHEYTGRGEVNYLMKGTIPQNCKIIAHGQHEHCGTGRREFYLVEVIDVLVFMRICTAGSYVDYDEFAVIHGWEPLNTNDAEELRSHSLRMIESLCGVTA
jgi:hypothetical protein